MKDQTIFTEQHTASDYSTGTRAWNNAQLQQSCHFLHERVISIVLCLYLYIRLDLRLRVLCFT